MKKKFAIILAAALAASVFAGGCGSRSSETSASSESSSLAEADKTIKTRELMKLIDYDPDDYVTLPDDYMSTKVTLYKDDYKVTDSDVKAYIKNNVLAQYPTYYVKTSKKTVENKDVVNIDYEGKVNGKTFDGGSADDQFLTIGSGSFIDGFEDGLIGKKVGKTVKLNLKFPKDYSEKSLQGKKVVFTVKINYIAKSNKVTYKTMNDTYVKQNFTNIGCSTVDELKNYVEQNLSTQASQQQDSDAKDKLLTAIVKASKFKSIDDLVDKRVEQSLDEAESYAKSADLKLADFLKQNYNMTESEYKKQLKKSLPDTIQQDLVLQAVIEDQKVTVEGEEYNQWVKNIMSSYYISSVSDFYKQYEPYGGRDYILMQYAESQALQKIQDSANVTFKLGSAPSSSSDSSSSSSSSSDSSSSSSDSSSDSSSSK